MKPMSNPSSRKIKALFFQWVVENFLIPDAASIDEHINLIIFRNHLINFPLKSMNTRYESINNFQVNRVFYYFDHIDNLDMDIQKEIFSEAARFDIYLVIKINNASRGEEKFVERCIALKEQLGIKYILLLVDEFDFMTSEIYGIKEVNLNNYVFSNSDINDFIFSLVGQTNWLFYGLNLRRTLLEFSYLLNSIKIGDAMKSSYCGLLYLFEFYSRNGYLSENIYDGYHSYMDFCVNILSNHFGQSHVKKAVSRFELTKFLQEAAVQSEFAHGKWIIQSHLLEEKESYIFEQTKFNNPLWIVHQDQVAWSQNELRDFWVADYLAGEIKESDYHYELIHAKLNSFSSMILAFVVAKITRKFLRPYLALDFLIGYLDQYTIQSKFVVHHCIEMAGENVLGWKNIDEKLGSFVLSAENRKISSMIGVL